ncbi:MAG: hypothetical protein R3E52_15385 [Burkholderiaceae bacterium]
MIATAPARKPLHPVRAGRRGCRGAAMRTLMAVLPIAVIALTTQLVPAWARARATQVESLQTDVQPATPLQAPAVRSPAIEAPSPAVPHIEVRKPSESAPRIEAPPVVTGSLTPPRDAHSAEVQHELQRLRHQADASRSFGSTPSSAQAAWVLGLIYLHGAGVRRDPALAQQWFQRAARLGREPWAYAGLAWCAIDGCVGPPNVEEANRNIALLRRRHPARADYLAWVLASRQAPVQVANNRMGQAMEPEVPDLALLQRAAAAGDVQANLELGIMAATDHHTADAQRYLQRASPQSRAAEVDLQILKNGGVTPNRAVLPSPTPNVDAQAALAMAQRYHRGLGVPANFAEAIRFYRLAADRGSQQAKRMLALIYSRPMPNGSVNIGWMQQLAYVDPLTTIPSLPAQNAQMMQRDPTPLFDLMPAFWRQQLTQVER